MTNKLLAITAVSLFSLASLSLSIMPSEANTTTAQLKNKSINLTKKCRAAITTATNRLEKNPSLKVVQSPTSKIDDLNPHVVDYSDHPQGRPHRQSFSLQGAGVKLTMNSSVLLASIAKLVINNCNSVSLVSFGAFGTDWIEEFGLMSNEKVQKFNCPPGFAPPFFPRPLQWGESCNP